MNIKELDPKLIQIANNNSFSGERGNISNRDYHKCADRICSWNIGDAKKQKLLNKLHQKWTVLLDHESKHVSVMVAGPAKYNAKRLDHSDRIIMLSKELYDWLDNLESQVNVSQVKNNKADELISAVNFAKQPDNPCNPTTSLSELAFYDKDAFMKLYDELYPTYKWRKNSTIAKLYAQAKAGTLKELKKEVFYEDENLTAYTYGDRAYIKFTLKPQRPLIVALKSRKWWWNSYESAWSTYPDKLDKDWVASISERYAQYV